jgi:hypothetical protein
VERFARDLEQALSKDEAIRSVGTDQQEQKEEAAKELIDRIDLDRFILSTAIR